MSKAKKFLGFDFRINILDNPIQNLTCALSLKLDIIGFYMGLSKIFTLKSNPKKLFSF